MRSALKKADCKVVLYELCSSLKSSRSCSNNGDAVDRVMEGGPWLFRRIEDSLELVSGEYAEPKGKKGQKAFAQSHVV
jgi:hypothetical protein